MKLGKKINKYVEYITTKIRLIKEQKTFEYNKVNMKYILKEEKNAKVLVVVFSACTRKGLKARYNYMRTLDGFNCHRLYILDDAARDGRGCYYLGKNCEFGEEKATIELIKNKAGELNVEKILFCGSSKGGYAALNIGLQFENAHIIVGGPQYYLASYLKEHKNFDTYDYIMGEETEEKIELIEHYLENRIKCNKYVNSQMVDIHYSNKEHTYGEHVVHILNNMKSCGYDVREDVADYENHSEISYYFPDFLKKKVMEEINDI